MNKKTPLELLKERLSYLGHPHHPVIESLPHDLAEQSESVQIVVINHHIRGYMIRLEETKGISTINERFCLVDAAATQDWFVSLGSVFTMLAAHG